MRPDAPPSTQPALPRRTLLAVLAMIVLVLMLAGTAVVTRPWNEDARAGVDDDPLMGPTYYANPQAVCGLLDHEGLELALGHPYAAGIAAPPDTPALVLMPGMVRCVYSSGLAGGSGGFVAVGVAYAYAEQVFDRTLEAREERDMELVEIDGLGDRAVWSAGDLLVRVDDKLLGVHAAIETPTERDRFVHTRRLVEKALERLR